MKTADDQRSIHVVRDGDVDALVTKVLLHDANNMLQLIQMTLALMEPGERISHEGHAVLVETSQRLSSLLHLGARQRQAAQPRLVSVNVAVTTLLPMLRLLATDRIVKTHLESELPDVTIDPVDLERAIVNLVANARDANSPGDRIVIGAQLIEVPDDAIGEVHAGRWIEVSVEDRGAGMSPATLRRATEPFFTTKGPDEGSGLGLASVARIVRTARGHLKIASVPGIGTTVRVWLPVA